MPLTTRQKEIMIGGTLVVGGLGYYYYTKNRQKTVTITRTQRSTVTSTQTQRTSPTQTVIRTNRTTVSTAVSTMYPSTIRSIFATFTIQVNRSLPAPSNLRIVSIPNDMNLLISFRASSQQFQKAIAWVGTPSGTTLYTVPLDMSSATTQTDTIPISSAYLPAKGQLSPGGTYQLRIALVHLPYTGSDNKGGTAQAGPYSAPVTFTMPGSNHNKPSAAPTNIQGVIVGSPRYSGQSFEQKYGGGSVKCASWPIKLSWAPVSNVHGYMLFKLGTTPHTGNINKSSPMSQNAWGGALLVVNNGDSVSNIAINETLATSYAYVALSGCQYSGQPYQPHYYTLAAVNLSAPKTSGSGTTYLIGPYSRIFYVSQSGHFTLL